MKCVKSMGPRAETEHVCCDSSANGVCKETPRDCVKCAPFQSLYPVQQKAIFKVKIAF